MYHSVNFGSKNTYDDWSLVPDSRPVIAPPEVVTSTGEIPGTSGSIDFSELLTGYPLYKNRTGTLKFHVLNNYTNNQNWASRYSDIMSTIHGRVTRISLEDDPDYYYEGRVSVSEWTSNNDGTWSDISFNYNVDPYKYYNNPLTPSDDGYMKYMGINNYSINLGSDVGVMPIVPDIIVTNIGDNGITVTWSNPERNISNAFKNISTNGTYTFYDLILTNLSGSNNCTISITGSGKTTILFRKGML